MKTKFFFAILKQERNVHYEKKTMDSSYRLIHGNAFK
jgi:hypothetical protein